jgi:hypothetical protein
LTIDLKPSSPRSPAGGWDAAPSTSIVDVQAADNRYHDEHSRKPKSVYV